MPSLTVECRREASVAMLQCQGVVYNVTLGIMCSCVWRVTSSGIVTAKLRVWYVSSNCILIAYSMGSGRQFFAPEVHIQLKAIKYDPEDSGDVSGSC